ncbi:hypothetical protein EG831_00575 [bacterium]|nr:hypothetical protein [bacterium]
MMEHKGAHRGRHAAPAETRYDYYQEMVKILEKLKREEDLKIAPKLLDRILDGQKNGHLTAEQVFELSERIDKWTMKLQLKFASQEYQMTKLLRALESDQRKREGRK